MAGFFVIFASMKCLIWLLSVILIPLSAIDTLMQSQPDSALTVLLDEPTDEPYYQLLLSEALYKNVNVDQKTEYPTLT